MYLKALIKLSIGATLVALLGILAIHTPLFGTSHFEISDRLLQRVQSLPAFGDAQEWVKTNVTGRDISIAGTAPSEDAKQALVDAVEAMTGVRRVDAAKIIVAPNDLAPSPYRTSIVIEGDTLKLTGFAPNDAVLVDALELFAARFPKSRIINAAEIVAGDVPEEDWRTAISIGARALEHVRSGAFTIADRKISLIGGSDTQSALRSIESLMRAMPDRFETEINVKVADSAKTPIAAGGDAVKLREHLRAEQLSKCMADVRASIQSLDIEFASSSAVIDENAAEQIAGLAEVMTACPKLSLIIRGHTDSSGVETENVWLSAIRARSVARTLMDNQIAVDRLTWVGVGSSSPIADNATPEGRRLNRRIEIEAVINSSGE